MISLLCTPYKMRHTFEHPGVVPANTHGSADHLSPFASRDHQLRALRPRRRHNRPSVSMDKLPTCNRQQRNSGESPAHSAHAGVDSDRIHSRTVANVASWRDAVIRSTLVPAGSRSAVNSSRSADATCFTGQLRQ